MELEKLLVSQTINAELAGKLSHRDSQDTLF